MMTPAQREAFNQLRDANDGLCGCGGTSPSLCDKQHTGPCMGAATEPVIDPAGRVFAAVCRACKAGQVSAPTRANRRAKAERAKVCAAAQSSIFDLIND